MKKITQSELRLIELSYLRSVEPFLNPKLDFVERERQHQGEKI